MPHIMQCDRCQDTAAYTRKYSGVKLCSACFTNSILRKTAKTISKYNMIKNRDLVGIAVSGGKDSLALLQIMQKISSSHNFKIKAITIDEGIPTYRDEALNIVRDFCSSLDIEHTVYSYKDLFDMTLDQALDRREEKMSSCGICGTLRRRAIDHAARQIGADVIATGHNLDDTLQTFLINTLSGDTGKIGWMNPDTSSNSLRKIKPFCEIYESEIVFYAFTNNIPFQSEPCPHMNEGIRTEIREFLNSLESRHHGIKNSMFRSVIRLSGMVKESDYKQKRRCKRCGNNCTGEMCSVCDIILKLEGNQT